MIIVLRNTVVNEVFCEMREIRSSHCKQITCEIGPTSSTVCLHDECPLSAVYDELN